MTLCPEPVALLGYRRPGWGATCWPVSPWPFDQGLLPERDGGHFVRGLWQITHTNGPHPGTSDAGEARFRLQALTGAARYLIDRFTPVQ